MDFQGFALHIIKTTIVHNGIRSRNIRPCEHRPRQSEDFGVKYDFYVDIGQSCLEHDFTCPCENGKRS
jgi:hypothetical protein